MTMFLITMNLANKDCKNKCTKMNCWRKLANKFDMSPEDADKKFQEHSPFFVLSYHSDHMETS